MRLHGVQDLQEVEDRLVTAPGSGVWILGASVLVAVCASVLAVSSGAKRSHPASTVGASGNALPRAVAAALLTLGGLAVGAASLLTILAWEQPGEGFFRFTGWSQEAQDFRAPFILQFGYTYLAASVALVVAGILMGVATGAKRSRSIASVALGMAAFAVAGAYGLFWGMAVLADWIARLFELFEGEVLFSRGWGFWLLLVGACLATLGILISAVDQLASVEHGSASTPANPGVSNWTAAHNT